MDRAQAHTLEAFTAALLVLGAVLFALQATAVTPLTASTSNERVENQQRTLAEDLLSTTHADGTLRDAVVYWDSDAEQFAGVSTSGFFTSGGPPNAFGDTLNNVFRSERIAFNVYVSYQNTDGTRGRETMVYMGTPSNHAVVATQTVALYDDTLLTAPGATQTVGEAGTTFYAQDVAPSSPLHTVTEVRLVIWKM